jgi:excisionase family DNA binding protein
VEEEAGGVVDGGGDGSVIEPSPDNPLYTVRQVALMFGVDTATIRYWISKNKIQGHMVMGRWRIQRSEVIRVANKEYGG